MRKKMGKYDKRVLKDIEGGKFKKITGQRGKDKISALTAAAKNTLKDKAVNVRFNSLDLQLLKEKAALEGLHYQTLLGSVVHKYVTDQFLDRHQVNLLKTKSH